MKQKVDLKKLMELIDTPLIESKNKIYPINYSFRSLELTNARFIVFEFLYFNGMKLDRIGRIFSKSSRNGRQMDHTTVLNGINKAKEYLMRPRQNENFIQIRSKLVPLLNKCLYFIEEDEDYDYGYGDKRKNFEIIFTQLETDILNCKNYVDFMKLKDKIIENKKKIVEDQRKNANIELE